MERQTSYDASGWEGRVCSNRQSAVIWGGGGGIWPNRHITFIVIKKKLNSLFLLLYFRHMWGRGWMQTWNGGRDLAENVRIPSFRGGV